MALGSMERTMALAAASAALLTPPFMSLTFEMTSLRTLRRYGATSGVTLPDATDSRSLRTATLSA